jgi:hypothetical protein
LSSRRLVDGAWLASLAALALFATWAQLCPYALDYGEGPLCDQARRLAGGEGLYRADWITPPFVVDNYPPLYPLLMAAASRLLRVSFLGAGRLLSTLAALACAALLARLARGVTGDCAAGRVAAALFLSHAFVLEWAIVARVDLVALAWSLGALAIAQANPSSLSAAIGAAVCVVLAMFTKQTYVVAAPLTCSFWLARHRRAGAIVFVVTVAALAAGAIEALNHETAGGFVHHVVVANYNHYEPMRLVEFGGRFAAASAPALLFLIWRGAGWASASSRSLVVYAATSMTAALAVGKVGSWHNYLLEPIAAMALLSATVLPRDATTRLSVRLVGAQAVWGIALAAALLGTKLAEVAAQRRLAALVRATDGPVLADDMMVTVVESGRRIEFQPFEMRQLERAGRWRPNALLAALCAKRYALVVLRQPDGALAAERWPPEMLDQLSRNYAPVLRAADLVAYAPFSQRVQAAKQDELVNHDSAKAFNAALDPDGSAQAYASDPSRTPPRQSSRRGEGS